MGKIEEELRQYSEAVLDHFLNPRNVGDLPDATVRVSGDNPHCHDVVRLAIRLENGRVAAVRMKVFGCTVAIAAASAMTELMQGRRAQDLATISLEELLRALGGLPEERVRCTLAARNALARAVSSLHAAEQTR